MRSTWKIGQFDFGDCGPPDLYPSPTAVTGVFRAPTCGSPLLILRHGFSGEIEGAKVQRRWWPQRDSNPCFSLERSPAVKSVRIAVRPENHVPILVPTAPKTAHPRR